MFKELRLKMAVRQSFSLGIMMIALLSLILLYNVTRVTAEIDRNLSALTQKGFSSFSGSGEYVGKGDYARDTLTIYIDRSSNVFLSNIAFYDSDTLNELIKTVRKEQSGNGRTYINGNYIAYFYQVDPMGEMIFIYDYTRDILNLRNTTVVILIAGTIGLIAITVLSFRSAKNSVAPVQAAFDKQQELVANASHELKTPLTIINTDLSILNSSRESMTEEQVKWLDSINGQVMRMSALVTEMLELAKVEASVEKQLRETVNMSEVTERVVLESEALAYEQGVSMETDIKPDLSINAVRGQIEKVLYILIDNAIKYSGIGGKVKIGLFGDRRKVVLRVRNTGDGIARENIPKLFDRFYRTDESHTESGSFGLGLAIAKSIVDAHGGTIGVDSKVGEYTEFIVVLRQAS